MNANGRLRVGVIGAGHMGRLHARAIARREKTQGDVELAWTIDRHAARSGGVAHEFGGQAGDALSMLRGQVDAAVVSVPTGVHHEVSAMLLGAGIDVLVEKPMAVDAAAARALVERADGLGRILAVGHAEWFNAGVVRAREAVARADTVEVVREAPISGRGLDLDVIQDLMLHDLDWLARSDSVLPKVRRVRASRAPRDTSPPAKRADDPAYVDEAEVELELSAGRRARLRASRVAPARRRYVVVERGAQRETIDLWAEPEDERAEGREPLDLAWADFVTACHSRQPPTNGGREGAEVLALVESIQAALRSGEGRAC